MMAKSHPKQSLSEVCEWRGEALVIVVSLSSLGEGFRRGVIYLARNRGQARKQTHQRHSRKNGMVKEKDIWRWDYRSTQCQRANSTEQFHSRVPEQARLLKVKFIVNLSNPTSVLNLIIYGLLEKEKKRKYTNLICAKNATK
jgi:hypothetical protein